MPEPNPHSFRASDGYQTTTIRGCCNPENSAPKHVKTRGRSLKGTEQVTLPVKFPSLFHDGPAFAISVGAKNVSTLKVSTSNTLFDSCTTFLNPIASSNLAFHSNRAWADSAYRVYRPPNRPLWWIVQGNTARASLTASGLVLAPGEVTPGFGPSVSLLPPNGNSLPPRWVGGSVKVAKVRRSSGMGYTPYEKVCMRCQIKPYLPVGKLGIS